jgi:hypothetical protein
MSLFTIVVCFSMIEKSADNKPEKNLSHEMFLVYLTNKVMHTTCKIKISKKLSIYLMN